MLCLGVGAFAGLAEWRLEDTHAGALATDRRQHQRDSVHFNVRAKSALGRDEKGRCARGSARRWITWAVIAMYRTTRQGHTYK